MVSSQAAVIITAANGTATADENTPFTVLGNDIAETNGTFTLFSGSAEFSSDAAKLNDGSKYGGGTVGQTPESFAPSNGTVALLTLDGAYNISSIVSLTGQQASRNGQDYAVKWSSNGTDFSPLTSVGGETNNVDTSSTEVQVTISDDAFGFIALGVTHLQFTFSNVGASNGESVYREIDVLGSAVPEPSSSALLGLGALALILRRRK